MHGKSECNNSFITETKFSKAGFYKQKRGLIYNSGFPPKSTTFQVNAYQYPWFFWYMKSRNTLLSSVEKFYLALSNNLCMPTSEKKYYSLLEITRSLESVIQKTYTKSYWVKAEIAKLNFYTHSGHCYPELVEKESGKVLAQIRSTIWAGNFDRINNKFRKITRENLDEGMTVLFLAKVGFHPVYGISLNISDIEPAFTLGEMTREKTDSIERLKKEGLFLKNKAVKKALLPKRIAIISVETSKGYKDFIQILSTNEWGYGFFQMLFPALLQGDGAVKSIKAQLSRIREAIDHFDVVVIIRGGGGDIGLSSFDNYSLAKTVATFPIPVLSGIGHATNETVVEMVAYANKITPTDLAYYLIQQFHNFSVRLQNAQKSIFEESQKMIQTAHQQTNEQSRLFHFSTRNLINTHHTTIAFLAQKLERNALASLNKENGYLSEVSTHMTHQPLQLLTKSKHKLLNLQKELVIFSQYKIKSTNTQLELLYEKVNLLKPENILKRGYSITTFNGKPIRDVKQLAKDEIVETTLFKGKIKSKIESIEK